MRLHSSEQYYIISNTIQQYYIMWNSIVCVCARLGWKFGNCTKIEQFANVWPWVDPCTVTALDTGQEGLINTAFAVAIGLIVMYYYYYC